MNPFGLIAPLFLPKAYMLAALTVCPAAEAPPKVEVLFTAEMTRYSEQYRSSHLKSLMRENRDSTLATDKRSTTFGVTSSTVRHETRLQFNILDDRKGRQCLYIDTAVFRIFYAPTVYVSADILDMSCSYNVTRAHEQTHVEIDYKTLQDYLPYIRRDMANYLNAFAARGFGPYPSTNQEKLRNELMKQVSVAITPMVERMREARRQKQGSIDTLENYRREAQKCPQDYSLIRKRFGGGRE